MAKYWKYTPNEVTDKLMFSIDLMEGLSSARTNAGYPYHLEMTMNKANGSWSVTNAILDHYGSRVDNTETVNGIKNNFITINSNDIEFRYTSQYPIVKIECQCAAGNGTPVDVQEVNTKRIHFIKKEWLPQYNFRSLDNPQWIGRFLGVAESMWYCLGVEEDGQELEDIVFSNLTESITLPDHVEDRLWIGFNGFGLLNITCPDRTHQLSEHPLSYDFSTNSGKTEANGKYTAGKLRTIREYWRNGNGDNIEDEWNVIEGERLADLNDDELMSDFAPEGIWYAFPLYYQGGTMNYFNDPVKYGSPRTYADICANDLNPYNPSLQNN